MRRIAHPLTAFVLRLFVVLGLLTLSSASTASAQQRADGSPRDTTPRDTTPVAVLREYVAAFNAKQLDAMVAMVADDVLWMSIADDSAMQVGRGAEAFRRLLAGYFSAVPSARSELLAVNATGPWVTTHERTRWDAVGAGAAGQSSVVAYEVRQGLIRRLWFYPALPY